MVPDLCPGMGYSDEFVLFLLSRTGSLTDLQKKFYKQEEKKKNSGVDGNGRRKM